MRSEACERYLQDPEGNAGHLKECADCAALFTSDVPSKPLSIDPRNLPLAPWEGATYRAWPLVLAGGLAVLAIATALFTMAGISPTEGIRTTFSSSFPSVRLITMILGRVGEAAQHAPSGWQIGIAISFVVINTVLVILLRRAPKGIDV